MLKNTKEGGYMLKNTKDIILKLYVKKQQRYNFFKFFFLITPYYKI